ncbi:MAG TPA: hypothetical protein VKZ98_11115, partial [Aquaticitalea sp.]|nr:hypothetical protein [Aquaticitalea sp.]
MSKRLLLYPFLLGLFSFNTFAQAHIFKVKEGRVKFSSETKQELINAASEELIGVMDIEKRIFAFKVSIQTFEGFNSPLQREHFNENYMESTTFPAATYIGKIIEDVDLTKEGTYKVRTKGKLKTHGVEQEKIINAVITIKEDEIKIQSDFIVLLAEH